MRSFLLVWHLLAAARYGGTYVKSFTTILEIPDKEKHVHALPTEIEQQRANIIQNRTSLADLGLGDPNCDSQLILHQIMPL